MNSSYPPPLKSARRAAWRPLLAAVAVMSSLLAWPTAGRAQQPAAITTPAGTAAPAEAPVIAPVLMTFTASSNIICLGDSVTLTVEQGRQTVFSWVASTGVLPDNLNLPGRAYSTIVVAPTVTTTYTVSSISRSATLTITVKTNCCESAWLTRPPIIIPGGEYSGFNNPFSAPGPYAVYSVTGDITLTNGQFYISNKVLMAPGTSIYVGTGAALWLEGGSGIITAACNEMWGGIYVTPLSLGFKSRNGPNYVGVQAGPNGLMITEQFMNSCIRHSRYGIVLNNHSNNYLRLRGINFQHCLQGVTFDCTNGSPALATDGIIGCTFDSDPALMKAPFKYQSASNYHYSEAHVNLGGDVSAANLTKNVFNHALFGVRSHERQAVKANLTLSDFRDCYLAGAHFVNQSGVLANANVGIDVCKFFFPRVLPFTQQINNAVGSGSLATGQRECIGLLALQTPVRVIDSHFVRPDSTDVALYGEPMYGFSGQTGIYANQLALATSNHFRLLYAGISLTAGQQAPAILEGNTMLNCARAVELGDRQGGTAGIVVTNSCNTFARYDGKQREGNTYGFYALPNTSVVLRADINGSGPIKNRFALDQNGIAGQNYSIYNAPTNGDIIYKTFLNSPPYGNFASDITATSIGVVVNPIGSVSPAYIPPGNPNPNGCITDGYFNTGLQRPALAVGRKIIGGMKAAVPNPVADETTIGYVLPIGTHRAELLIRTGLAGNEIRTISLSIGEQASRLSVRDLPSGLYFCTLLADGLPVQTQRLLVAH